MCIHTDTLTSTHTCFKKVQQQQLKKGQSFLIKGLFQEDFHLITKIRGMLETSIKQMIGVLTALKLRITPLRQTNQTLSGQCD